MNFVSTLGAAALSCLLLPAAFASVSVLVGKRADGRHDEPVGPLASNLPGQAFRRRDEARVDMRAENLVVGEMIFTVPAHGFEEMTFTQFHFEMIDFR